MVNKTHINHFKDYLLGNCRSEATIQSYIRTIRQFLDLVDKEPKNIRGKDLDKYKIWANKTKQYDVNTLTPKYAAINSYMEYLKRPYRLKPPSKRIKNKIPLTKEEIKKLFKASEQNKRDHALLKILYYGQLRRSEVIKLNIEDIDFERQKIRLNQAKGNQYAEINIHPDVLIAIREYMKIREPEQPNDKALFLNRYGVRIGKTDISQTTKKYAIEIGLSKRIYPHLFRISSITHMTENGLNLEEIRRQSRHKDFKTLQSYMQLSDEHVKDAYMRGLSFDEPTQPKTPEPKFQEQTQIQPVQLQTNNLQQQLVQRLANGEITNEVFQQAINLLKQQKGDSVLSGYI